MVVLSYALAIATLVITGCTPTRRVVVTGGAIHAQLGVMRKTGSARVETAIQIGDRATPSTEVIGYDQEITVNGKRRSFADLGYLCSDVPPEHHVPIPNDNRCELLTHRDDPFLLRSQRGRPSAKGIAQGVLAGVVLGGLIGGIACAAECPEPYQTISIVTLSTLVVAVLWSCFHSTSCRD